MQKITPFIWFEDKAEQAAEFYTSVFSGAPSANKESKILSVNRYDEAGSKASGMPVGSVMVASFSLFGQEFNALNGGPPPVGDVSLFNPVSFVVNCETQEEVDYYWEKLSEGGEKGVCGWINKDKFGITWQITPTVLVELLNDPDPVKAKRVMEAMIKMTKIEIAPLKAAYDGK